MEEFWEDIQLISPCEIQNTLNLKQSDGSEHEHTDNLAKQSMHSLDGGTK
jgi:hypothetical protein